MAKVLAVGGVLFRSPDPAELRESYSRWLGVPADEHGAIFPPDAIPPEGLTVWSPFPEDAAYLAPSQSGFMINLAVDEVAVALDRVRAGGGEVVGTIGDYDCGRFGWFVDPDGNKIELWQPPPAAARA